ncbi:glycoside hydrolase family 15 protein [Methanotorris formicicus]|uniref:Glycoside hydrolase 15-related protein n=1 Tax=Methanotorris formicicus Mc-S-70 TaxID=647171 RepID=H1KZ72_9EURY|nr:glycoside hydrolase family 15 protein [Methanotorris formicicus]EHP86355.1 glycoside hydrolase 15-related protein [Methanotorris formicicus Mc-S-70]
MSGIIGNGNLLAKVNDLGSIEYAFFPHLGYETHVLDTSFALYYNNQIKWHWDYSWDVSQSYLKDTNILKTTYENDDFLIYSKDCVSISHNLIVKHLSIINKTNSEKDVKLFFYENLRIGEAPSKNTVKFVKEKNCLIKYDKNYVFCIGSDREITSYQCGIKYSESSALRDIENGMLKEQNSATGLITDSALSWEFKIKPDQKYTLSVLILPEKYDGDYNKILNLMDTLHMAKNNLKDLYNLTRNFWKSRIDRMINKWGILKVEEYKKYIEICKRSLLTLLLLCDYKGGIIASPSLYPDYRYVWCRDAGYMAVALDLCGQHEMSEKYFEWCKTTQNSDGSWVQNYYVEGYPRFTAIQIDQVGTTIWALLVHYRITGDGHFLRRNWEMVKRAGDYLSKVANKLIPCYDLWEEKFGVFAYTLGAIYGGLKSGYLIGKELDKEEEIQHWKKSMDFLKDVVNNLYLKDEGRFAKSIKPLDESIDTSILGLSFPYGLVPVDDPRMISTANQIEKAFNYKIGGIGRYPEDIYFGGNPWIITTLWLYMYYKKLVDVLSKKGKFQKSTIDNYNKKCNNLLKWVLKHQFNGMFPEQVHKDLGIPVSAIPLGWSHAMVIMAIHSDYDILIP